MRLNQKEEWSLLCSAVDCLLSAWPRSRSTDGVMRDVIDSPAHSQLVQALSHAEDSDVRVLPVALAVDPFQPSKDDAKYSCCPFLVVSADEVAVATTWSVVSGCLVCLNMQAPHTQSRGVCGSRFP